MNAKSLKNTLAFLQQSLNGASQLSSTIYFNKTKSIYANSHRTKIILNKEEIEHLDNLAEYINFNNKKIKKVIVIGFSDKDGDFNSNKKLSLKRAKDVIFYLREKGISNIKATPYGLGDLIDIDCDNKYNRRVEIWVIWR